MNLNVGKERNNFNDNQNFNTQKSWTKPTDF